MPSHGFCIFKVDLHDGERRDVLPYSSAGMIDASATALDELVRYLESWDDAVYSGRFKLPANESDVSAMFIMRPHLRGEKSLRFRSVSRVNDRRIDVTFEFGTPGSHELAIAGTGLPNTPLSDKAPGNVYRASLLVARDYSTAVLVGQARSRTCPAVPAFRLSTIAMRRERVEESPDQLARYWSLSPHRVAYAGRLQEIVANGQIREIEFAKHEVSSSGKRKPRKSVTLTQHGIRAGVADAATGWMLKWLDPSSGSLGNPSEREEEVRTAAQTMMEVSVTPEDYDEVGFVVEDSEGKPKTISPSSIAEVFIFPNARDQPVASVDELLDEARVHLKDLPITQGIDLDF